MRAKSRWPIEPAREVVDKTLAAMANVPSKTPMRIVRVESERRAEVGRFGAIMSLKTPEWKIEKLTLTGICRSFAQTTHASQSAWA
jgi:hypothetical protein